MDELVFRAQHATLKIRIILSIINLMMIISQLTPQRLLDQWYEQVRNEIAKMTVECSSPKWLEVFQSDLHGIRSLYDQGIASARETCRALRSLFDQLVQKKRETYERRHTDVEDPSRVIQLLEHDIRRPSANQDLSI